MGPTDTRTAHSGQARGASRRECFSMQRAAEAPEVAAPGAPVATATSRDQEAATPIEIDSSGAAKKSAAASYAVQLFWFTILVCIQCTAFLLFKLVQVSDQYTFSVASSVAITEMLKLVLAVGLHARNLWSSGQTVLHR